MGCDIHCVAEYRMDRWIGSRVLDYPFRNYNIFGSMCAGVRRDVEGAIPARGLPNDISGMTRDFLEKWQSDGHSHSWLSYGELTAALKRVLGEETKEHLWPDWVHEFLEPFEEMPSTVRRLVFWFDN